jgi:hypothetical protein
MDALVVAAQLSQATKAKMLTQSLLDVKERHKKWDLDFMFKPSDDDAMKEVL